MIRERRSRVVIVGAGFGGLSALRALANSPVDVALVDRNNYHTFLALLYQVAAAELEPAQIAHPVRSILRRIPNASFAMSEVKRIDLTRRMVEGDALQLSYDYLIVATGSVSHFYKVLGASDHALSLKSLDDAVALRNHVLGCLERAVHEPDLERSQGLVTFTIVGGGSTGVEFAGALAELLQGPLAKDYPDLDLRKARILLLEAMDGLLPGFPRGLASYAERRLRRMGVEVRLGAQVSEVTSESVGLQDGTNISTETTVWAAGVHGHPLAQESGLPTNDAGRVTVLPTLQLPGHPEVYAVGDLAYMEQEGKPLPMVAPVAIQQGAAVARNIANQLSGEDPKPFRYSDPGIMATIGRNVAVACIGRRSFTGFPAWILWLAVHIWRLIGFRNRLFVLLGWAWDYFLRDRAIRLVLKGG